MGAQVMVSVVIPVGPGHEHVAVRAIQSAKQQSLPVEVITVADPDGHGAGWARNQGMARVTTDWVIFLDADDWLEPDAVAAMLQAAAANPGRYVYTDWYRESEVMETPQTGYAWCGGTWHPITALLPTAWVRDAGGFDESLAGGEDTDLYLNLITGGRCGVRLARPLLHYSADGQRGFSFVNRADFKTIMQGIRRRYETRGYHMGCCGQTSNKTNTGPVGAKQDGDILAVAAWGGNRQYVGKATQRRYGRLGNGKTFWCDARDIDADRGLMPAPDNTTPEVDGLGALAAMFDGHMRRIATPKPRGMIKYAPEPQQIAPPDVQQIIRMGIEAIDA